MKSITLLALMALLSSCKHTHHHSDDSGVALPKFDLANAPKAQPFAITSDGTWRLFCFDASHQPSSDQVFPNLLKDASTNYDNLQSDSYSVYLMKKGDAFLIATAFNQGSCANEAKTDDIFQFDLIMAAQCEKGSSGFSSCTSSYTGLRPHNEAVAKGLNDLSYCGSGSWSSGIMSLITDQNCNAVKAPDKRQLWVHPLYGSSWVLLENVKITESNDGLKVELRSGEAYTATKVADIFTL